MGSKYKITTSTNWCSKKYRFIGWDIGDQRIECLYAHKRYGFISIYAIRNHMSARAIVGNRAVYVCCEPGATTPEQIRSIVSRILLPQVDREVEAMGGHLPDTGKMMEPRP